PFEVNLKVDSFHQAEDGDPVNCDTAFLEDATSGKTTPTASPTATEEQEPPTSTATATPPQKEPPTATPTPTAPQPPTATPTATNTPELFKLLIAKNDTDQGFGLAVHVAGWEMKVFAGDGCTGSPVASGLTSRRTIVPGLPFDPLDLVTNGYSVQLPAGAYSVAETQQQGWERVSGTFCQNVQVPEDSFVTFRNRRTRDGDVNKDGVTNSIDVVLVLQVIAGLIPEQPNTVKADVNRDRMVNAIDTALMLQFEAGLIPSLPVVPDDN
ncbi:MAG: dockerin type I repeat-containing protein, partial [Chloroflexi bacterium]|nr:dockerin type I repeat-containing protein [Chloroflexota bacterium]